MKLDKSVSIVGSNAERTRLHNRQVVLQLVRNHQPVGRAELARLSGLTTQTVSNIIAELESDAFLIATGTRSIGRGLPSVQYALKPDGAFALGIEIRPDVMFVTLVDLIGETPFSKRVIMPSNEPSEVARLVVQMRDEAVQSAGLTNADLILGAGVVMPGPFGPVHLSGGNRSELEGWDDVDPVVLLQDALDMPVVVENDATAAAVAERVNGVAQKLKTYCYVYFGIGLGLGLVFDNHVMRGTFGNAGEIGHITVHCGAASGPLESFASRVSLREHMSREDIVVDNVETIETLFLQNNKALASWLDQACEPLSHAIGMIENLFDPETVILGGAMPDVVLDHIISHLHLTDTSVSNRADRELPRVLRGASGRMTAALGGAALVIHDTFTPRIKARH